MEKQPEYKAIEEKPKKSLQQQADEVLKLAEEKGVQANFFFITTFKRYQVQMTILSKLEKVIAEEGALVEKEYVKGRRNLYTNPAVAEYNKTASSANNTVTTLINIVKNLEVEEKEETGTLDDVIKKLMDGSDE